MKAYLHRNGQTYGPYPEESLRGFIESGHAAPSDLACAVGAEEWVRLGDLLGKEGEGEEKETQGEALDDQEILEYAEKIKVLISSDNEELAIDLLRSLNSPRLYEELLKDCSIDEDGKPQLPNWLINDEGDESISFFLELIAHCPEETQESITKSLTYLDFRGSESLTNLEGLRGCTNLTILVLLGCNSLINVDVLSDLTNLTWLNLADCSSLTNVDGLSGLTNLTEMNLSYCSSLTNLDVLSGLTNLTSLYLGGASLTNVDVLSGLTNLWMLTLRGDSLTNVDALSGLTNLARLTLGGDSLTNVEGLSGLTNLTSLNLVGCKSLINVDGLRGCTNLKSLDLEGCSSLTDDQVEELRNSLPECEINF